MRGFLLPRWPIAKPAVARGGRFHMVWRSHTSHAFRPPLPTAVCAPIWPLLRYELSTLLCTLLRASLPQIEVYPVAPLAIQWAWTVSHTSLQSPAFFF